MIFVESVSFNKNHPDVKFDFKLSRTRVSVMSHEMFRLVHRDVKFYENS